jgi:hypothetical protein
MSQLLSVVCPSNLKNDLLRHEHGAEGEARDDPRLHPRVFAEHVCPDMRDTVSNHSHPDDTEETLNHLCLLVQFRRLFVVPSAPE